MTFIQNLQNKSDDQKKMILIVGVAVFMLLVIFVWILQMKNYSAPKITPKTETQLPPISDMKDEIMDAYNDSAEEIGEIRENFQQSD